MSISNTLKRAGALLAATTLMAGAVSVQAEDRKPDANPPTIDTNADGKLDAWDLDGDGKADAWDNDRDGKADPAPAPSASATPAVAPAAPEQPGR